jgi:hypothetical protein
MKLLVAAVLLTVIQTPAPSPKPIPNTDTVKEPSSAPPRTPPNADTTKTNPEDSNAQDKRQFISVRELPPISVRKDWTDRAYWTFSGFLVIVGLLQVALLWRTLRAIKRQADTMERQSGILEKNVIAAEANASAAQTNAEAAREGIEVAINKERARIRIEISGRSLGFKASDINEVSYTVMCHGYTPAFITDSRATVLVSPKSEPSIGNRDVPMSLPSLINPSLEGIPKSAILMSGPLLKEDDIERIDKGELFVHFYGFIKYRDVFGRGRETNFRYLWSLSRLTNSDGTHFGYWTKCGQPEANSET